MKKRQTTLGGLLIWGLYALIFSYAGIAAAVDSISLTPGSDITFTDPSDSRLLLFIQVNPPEAGVNLLVDVDTAVVGISSQRLTTDSDGFAELTITPGCEKNMVFLKVWAGEVESKAIFVENQAGCPTKLKIEPEELRIDWDNNPNSQATILLRPAERTTVTIINDNPDIVRTLPSLKTDSNGTAKLDIIGRQAGTAKVTARLADGTVSNPLIIDVVTGGIIITNVTETILGIGEQATFSVVTGGFKPYTWSSRRGDGTFDKQTGDEVTYTAPNYPGTFEVIVTDSKQQQARIRVDVTAPLKIVPESAYPKKGEPFKVQAIGGRAPYEFYMVKTTTAQVTQIGTVAEVTGLDSRGEFHVVVRDDLGIEAEAILTVVDGMQLSHEEVYITQKGEPKTIRIQNGLEPFDVRVEKGEVTLNDDEITVSVVDDTIENGTYRLVVRDARGETKETMIHVTIPGRLQISYSDLEVELGQTVVFEAIDGQAPYTFNADKGDLSCHKCAITTLTVIGTDSDITVKVEDSTGAKATAKVRVTPPIGVSDSFVELFPGESKLITVTGGSGIYSYNTSVGGADNTLQETSDGVIFTAPIHPGVVTLTVTDSRGSEPKKIDFDISVIKLAITPNLRYMDMGSGKKESFQIVKGEKDTNLKVWAEKGEVKREGDIIIYTPPQFVSDDVLQVVSLDSGEEAFAEIKIIRPLSITPTILPIDNSSGDASGVFRVSGGFGIYNPRAKYGSFEPQSAEASEDGVDITYIPSKVMKNDEVITVKDSKIDGEAAAMVELNHQLMITPLMATLAPGESVEFIGRRGAPPYDVSVTGGETPDQRHGESGEVRYLYTAPAETGTYEITITDGGNNKATAEIFVTTDLSISVGPTILRSAKTTTILRPGESTTININGGSAPYGFTTTIGQLSEIDKLKGKARYTAPLDFEGEAIEGDKITAYVKAVDADGVKVSTEIPVIKTPNSLISANSKVFFESDYLKINLTSFGEGGPVDVYVAIRFPGGQIFFFGEGGMPTPEPFTPYLRNHDVISKETAYHNVFAAESLPPLEKGKYTLFSLFVKAGTPTEGLSDHTNWLGDLSMFDFHFE